MRTKLFAFVSCFLFFAASTAASSAASVDSASQESGNRGHDPWVFRTNLDDRIRMLVIALRKDFWIAYSTEYSSIYKVWRDGINFEGMVYTKNPSTHPATIGPAYLLSNNQYPWHVVRNGKTIQPKVRYLGHRLLNNTVTLIYALDIGAEKPVRVEETPELVRDEKGIPGLERRFRTFDVPEGIEVKLTKTSAVQGDSPNKVQPLNSNDVTIVTTFFPDGPLQSATQQVEQAASEGERLVKSDDCNLCHDVSDKAAGPSFKTIADRYTATPDIVAQLVDSIIKGVSGKWGSHSMPPHPDLLRSDAEYMVQYILGLNNDNKELLAQEDPSAIYVFFARLSGWLQRKYDAFLSLFSEEEVHKPQDLIAIESPLESVHPSFDLSAARPESFKPHVGGLDFGSDGSLYVTTWDSDGAVYRVSGLEGEESEISVEKIAAGLAEPLGIKVLDDGIYVTQKQEFTRLRDTDNDGIIDIYENITNAFPATTNFHEFAFGLLYRDDIFYASLSTAVKPGGLPDTPQLPLRGTVVKIDRKTGDLTPIASGFRTPNGLGFGDDGALYVADNQGVWLPANKIIRVRENGFYGFRGLSTTSDGPTEEPPLVYIPQDDIGQSPSEPVTLNLGPYQNQLLYGDVTHGGIKRVSIHQVDDVYQGCVYRFSQGFESGVNRLRWGPDGQLYVGQIGVRGGWLQQGKLTYGLQRLKYNRKNTFEFLSARVFNNGVELKYTKSIDKNTVADVTQYRVFSWYYEPTAEYGGPKVGLKELAVNSAKTDENGQQVFLSVDGLEKDRIVYIWSGLQSETGESAWAREAWCTVNKLENFEDAA